jgi:nucleoside-diphosphate-sugar epimerase
VTSILLATDRPLEGLHTYFISDGQEYTWKETFDLLAGLLRKNPLNITLPWAPARSLVQMLACFFPHSPAGFFLDKLREMHHGYWVCDISRARKELGFNPHYDLKRGLKETINWYQAEGWL